MGPVIFFDAPEPSSVHRSMSCADKRHYVKSEIRGPPPVVWQSGVVAEGTDGQRPLAVVDLDGVVADVRHRLRFVRGPRKDWNAFFDAAAADPVLPEGRAVVDRLAGGHEIVYLTGRPERTREATEAWLERHDLPRGRVVMRREGDRRPARVVKPRLLAALARGRAVGIVVDDDTEVCAAYEREGWPVLRADWMPAAPELHDAQERSGRT
jgi:hypothetical protein